MHNGRGRRSGNIVGILATMLLFYNPERDAVIVAFFNKLNAFDEQANEAEQWG